MTMPLALLSFTSCFEASPSMLVVHSFFQGNRVIEGRSKARMHYKLERTCCQEERSKAGTHC